MMNIELVHRSAANTDWHIGYLAGTPAVADDTGAWYEISEGMAIHNPYEGFVWIVRDGKWTSIHEDRYQGETTHGDDITLGGPDYVEDWE